MELFLCGWLPLMAAPLRSLCPHGFSFAEVHSHRTGGLWSIPTRRGLISQLYLLDLASRQERQLTISVSDKYFPAWSPDGRWIVYSSNAGGYVQIYTIAASGGEEKVFTSGYERMGP